MAENKEIPEKNKRMTIVFTFDSCETKIVDHVRSVRRRTLVDIVYRKLCKERKDGIVTFNA